MPSSLLAVEGDPIHTCQTGDIYGDSSGNSSGDSIVGLWYFFDKDAEETAIAEIFEHNEKYYAIAFTYKSYESGIMTPVKIDTENPDPNLQNKTLDQVVIINELSFNGGEWVNGEMYNPSNGKYYYLSGDLENNKTKLIWKASVDKAGRFGSSLVWTKVENIEAYTPLRKTKEELIAIIPSKRFK